MDDYLLCGWRTRSNIELPELPRWAADDRPADVEIICSHGRPHDAPSRSLSSGGEPTISMLATEGPDVLVLLVTGVGRFRVEAGRRITVEESSVDRESDVRLFILGTALATLSYQRGLLPLHASCLALPPGGHAVAIAGASGAGKSTSAAALAAQGASILADDVCVVDPWASGGPRVLPSVARLKLWRDALDRFGISAEGMPRVRGNMEKFSLHDAHFHAAPERLAAIYHLTRVPTRSGTPETLAGLPAVQRLTELLYRPALATAMGRGAQITTGVMQVLRHTPLFSVGRSAVDDPDAPAVWDRVAEHHAQVGSRLAS